MNGTPTIAACSKVLFCLSECNLYRSTRPGMCLPTCTSGRVVVEPYASPDVDARRIAMYGTCGHTRRDHQYTWTKCEDTPARQFAYFTPMTRRAHVLMGSCQTLSGSLTLTRPDKPYQVHLPSIRHVRCYPPR